MPPRQGSAGADGRLTLPKGLESCPSVRFRVRKLAGVMEFRFFGFAQNDHQHYAIALALTHIWYSFSFNV